MVRRSLSTSSTSSKGPRDGHRLFRHRGAWCALALLGLLAPEVARSQTDRDLQQLRDRVRAQPSDLDLRLQLATKLSWRARRGEARLHALEVIRQAAHYWDAHVLVARLDAWDKNYAAARARLQTVLRAVPLSGHWRSTAAGRCRTPAW